MVRSLYYNPYDPHEEFTDEDEPGTEGIADVARQYECLCYLTYQVGTGEEFGNSNSGNCESDSDVTSPERNKAPLLDTANPLKSHLSAWMRRLAI